MQQATRKTGLISSLPVQLSSALAEQCSLAPSEPGRALNKWLKRSNEMAVILVVANGENTEQLLEALDYLRLKVGNRSTRLVCFANELHMPELSRRIHSHGIHRLQSLQDWNEEFLTLLLTTEQSAFERQAAHHWSRSIELELMTWLARFNRETTLTTDHRQELASIVSRLLEADVTLLMKDSGRPLLVQNNLDLHWNDDVADTWQPLCQNLGSPSDQRPISVELDKHHPALQQATQLTGHAICASLYLPLRCYDQQLGGVLLLMASDRLAHMEVGQINMLEKVLDQLRGTLERQQAEQRLQTQYQRLQSTLQQLHQTQEQLYHAEKLSSIGQLAAGIAHEINNPVAFVMSNFEPLDDYIQEMSRLLMLHDQFTEALQLPAEAEVQHLLVQLRQARQSADVDFLLDDVQALVQESRSGLKRVCDIVTSLRSFARKDSMELERADLVRCYQDSLTLLRPSLTPRITLESSLPEQAEAMIQPSLFGQVFINLIHNAIQALDGEGHVRVSIELKDQLWLISVRDNGEGIASDIQKKIFDPFFTTRPVGQGTGLGLSTVYSIVKRHHGSIRVSSKPGVGTEFRILLPLSNGAPASQSDAG